MVPGIPRTVELDYDLSAEFEPWQPPQPFDENTYSFPNRMFTKAELLEYLDYCRRRHRTLDEAHRGRGVPASPDAHRYHGMLYGVIVGGIPLHVVEHASQIRQFLTAAGIRVQAMPGDRGYAVMDEGCWARPSAVPENVCCISRLRRRNHFYSGLDRT